MEIVRSSVDEIMAAPNYEEWIRDYGEESGNPDLLKFGPNVERYKNLERSGDLLVAAAFDDGKNIVAVVSVFFYSIPHFSARVAGVETIWVRKDYRSKGLGMKAIVEVRELAKAGGAEGVYIGSRYGSRFERLLNRIATPMNVTYWMKV